MRCEGWSRQNDRPCQKNAIRGRRHCRNHGGKTPMGVNHPAFKDGHRSKYQTIPADLRAAYEAGRLDPERMELHAHVDLLNAKLQEVMASAARAAETLGKSRDGVPAGNPPYLELREQWAAYVAAAEGTPAKRLAMARIGAIIAAGAEVDQAWAQWAELAELMRRMVESQTRRDEKLGQYVPVDKVQMLGRQMVRFVLEEVRDAAAVRRIQARILSLMSRPQQPDPAKLPAPNGVAALAASGAGLA